MCSIHPMLEKIGIQSFCLGSWDASAGELNKKDEPMGLCVGSRSATALIAVEPELPCSIGDIKVFAGKCPITVHPTYCDNCQNLWRRASCLGPTANSGKKAGARLAQREP